MPKGRLVFDGDNIYTEKDARIYKLKTSVSSKIDAIPWVVDSLDSISATDALSANMGRQLQDQINSLSWTWKFLSTWDCTTWLPGTNPQEDPYTSTTVELENVWTNDKYYFDGADWVRIPDTAIQIAIDTQLDTTSTNAVENRAIANAINTKQNIISDLNTIRSWAAAWATALQKLDNISELTNNIWYQTAGDVNSAIQSAIWQLPTVNDWVLTIQKNSTTIDTFSANSANNKTINIPVPTTVAELSDANNYATKTDLSNAIDSLVHEWGTAPQNPQEWDMWYDTVNHVLKIYNWTTWETVDTDTDTTYTAWNGINISAQHEISVDTSVVATKEYVDDKMSSWSTAPANPVEWQIWYDVTNHILKIYNWTSWVPVDTDTTYIAWEGITISTATISDRKWPCSNWFHVPTITEVQWLKTFMDTLSLTSSNNWEVYLHIPRAGCRRHDSGNVNFQWGFGYYWTCSTSSTNACYFLLNSSTVNTSPSFYRTPWHSIRPFKDVSVAPDNSWTMLYDWSSVATWAWVFYNSILWIISISADWTTWLTIADKNVWATTVYNNWDALSESNCGWYFQRWNNYMFPFTWTVATSSTQVDASNYGPWNYYSSSTFIPWDMDWSSVQNDNLWWETSWGSQQWNVISSTAVSDEAFSLSWDWDTTHAPSKNAVYDVLGDVETLLANL